MSKVQIDIARQSVYIEGSEKFVEKVRDDCLNLILYRCRKDLSNEVLKLIVKIIDRKISDLRVVGSVR